MHDIDAVSGQEVQWVRSSPRQRRYELQAGSEVVASLTWARGSEAEGECSRRPYRFNRRGWVRRRTLVFSPPQSPEPLAIVVHRGSSSTLIFPDGRVFQWTGADRGSKDKLWRDHRGGELLRFSPVQAHVGVTRGAAADRWSNEKLPLLLLLGQYLLVSAQEDDEAATTAAITGAITAVIAAG
jgi:hypothetical protein